MKKRLMCLLLVFVMIASLLPAAMPTALAADGDTTLDPTAQVTRPARKLNKTYMGTVQFGSFNYSSGLSYKYQYSTGSDGWFSSKTWHTVTWNSPNVEGADYVMPFIYTDDYFVAPSYTRMPSAKTVNWTELENPSLATASMDFTMACFGSNEETAAGKDYRNYDKNGKQFLIDCGFPQSAVESNDMGGDNKFNQFPTTDSIGVIFGAKDIEVWNEETNSDEPYKLVAIGVRGAGYGAEWASNLTLGESGEHLGFRQSADKVEAALDSFLSRHNITPGSNVKFWVVGYSRAGAVANLVAGDLSAKAKYNMDKANVYGYTFEAAAGASMTADPEKPEMPVDNTPGTVVYPNIHNILNKLDPVPYVSSPAMGNNRLGADYLAPYYGNTSAQQNTDYYNRMYSILNTIAQGYQDLQRPAKPPKVDNDSNNDEQWLTSGTWQTDPVVENANQSKYPIDGNIKLYYFSIWDLATNSDNYPLGLRPYDDWRGTRLQGTAGSSGNYTIHIDDFLRQFVNAFFGSKAWDYDASLLRVTTEWKVGNKWTYKYGPGDGNATITNTATATDATTHRENYANNGNVNTQDAVMATNPKKYQDAIRYLVDKALGTPGGKLVDMLDGFSGDFLSDIESAKEAGGLALAVRGAGGYDSGPNENRASIVDSHMRDMLMDILANGGTFHDDTNQFQYQVAGRSTDVIKNYQISQETADAVAALSPVLARMYLYDRMTYGSQYFGTLLKYAMDTMIIPHIPEFVISWQMAMDDNFTSNYRETTLPLNTDVRMYVFRDGIDDPLSIGGRGEQIARIVNGQILDTAEDPLLDQRITREINGSNVIIRYPDTLDIRFDIKTSQITNDLDVQVATMQPDGYINVRADYDRAANGNVVPASIDLNPAAETNVTSASGQTVNSAAGIHLTTDETLYLLAWHGSNSLNIINDHPVEKQAEYALVKLEDPHTKVLDFGQKTSVDTGVTQRDWLPSEVFAVESSDLFFTPEVKRDGDGNYTYRAAFDSVYSDYYLKSNKWNRVDVVPASSVYYNDNVATAAQTSGTTTIDGAYNETDGRTERTLKFTFYGTGIDAYCTANGDTGWVKAEVYQGAEAAGTPFKSKFINSSYSGGALTNVPTISFRDLSAAADTYTLVITTSLSKPYFFDGVRVYNTAPSEEIAEKLQSEGQSNASYVNVRDLLLGKEGIDHLSQDAADVIADTAAFFTGVADGEATFAEYKTLGPKNEAYLTTAGEGVAFTVEGHDGLNVAIGLRCADGTSGRIKIVGASTAYLDVNGVDTYYTVTPDASGNVKIVYDGQCSGKIAITNIRLTDKAPAAAVPGDGGQSVPGGTLNASRRITTSAKLLSFVNAPDPEPVEELDPQPVVDPDPEPDPEPDPDPAGGDDTPAQPDKPVLPSLKTVWDIIWKNLTSVLSGLFRGLGNW